MADRPPGPSINQETAPLLRDIGQGEGENEGRNPSFADHVGAIAQEPLTPLTKVLLVLVLVLLLLGSVFIGLFAGAQHKLKLEQGRNGGGEGDKPPAGTATVTSTMISTATSTRVTTATTTQVMTTTLLPGPSPTKVPEKELCFTPDCIVLSASILSSLDTSKDPCENFYDFANGGWLSAHPLPVDKSSFGKFDALSQQNKQVIQRILESNSSMHSSQDADLLRKLRRFYSSCLNEQGLEDRGAIPLLNFVQTMKTLYHGGELQISAHRSDDDGLTDLTAALAYVHSRGISAFFSFEIAGDDGVDPDHMVLWFSQSGLSLPSKEYYKDESLLNKFQTVVERLIFALTESEETSKRTSAAFVANDGADIWPPWPWPPWGDDDDGDTDKDKEPIERRRRAHKLAKQVVKLERRLAKASLDLDTLYQDPVRAYNPLPLSNLTDSLPQVHFPTYFATFTPRTFPEKVIVTYPAYIASLSDILKSTSGDVIEAYLVVRAAMTLAPYLGMSTEAWRAQRELEEILTGIKVVGDRAEYCVGRIEEALGFATGRYFVNDTFTEESREQGAKVIGDIIESFKVSLPHIGWMDRKSAKAAAEKADAIRTKIGFPSSPNTEDPSSILKYYSSVKVNQDDFFGNMINATTNEIYKKWLQLGRRRNRDLWDVYPSTVNAYFNPSANEIIFPAGILQPPFFGKRWPSYLSYGAFGQPNPDICFKHAFDSVGRLYNQAGKLEEWWSNSTSKDFQIKQDCIVKQFSAYTIDDGKGGRIHINGNLTSGENIGDTGLIQSYRAWKAQYGKSRRAGNEYLLPGLNYTREQLFFISFAQIWGNAMKAAAVVQHVRSDPHSPSRYRVDGTVYNIPEFAEAFRCSSQAKLNPPNEKRCLFW